MYDLHAQVCVHESTTVHWVEAILVPKLFVTAFSLQNSNSQA